MINPVSYASVTPQLASSQPAAQPKSPQASSSGPQDTVQLSSKARSQASGDADHDGDSH
jgi:hypothetical protein